MSPANYARTVRIAPPAQAIIADAIDPGSTGRALLPPVLAPAPGHDTAVADPELLSLFAEEAREELEKISRNYPSWDQDSQSVEALGVVRRSFHTLKGSGRMVGARELSEFSWAMENLVNRLLDGTLARSPEILATLREAIALLPKLVAELAREHRTAPPGGRSRGPGACAGRGTGDDDAHGRGGICANADAHAVPAPVAAEPPAPAAVPAPPAPETPLSAEAPPSAAPEGEWAATAHVTPLPQPVEHAGRGRRCGAARNLCARNLEPRAHGAHLAGARAAVPGAARAQRGSVPGLPHAVGQLAHGGGAPRHAARRAAQSLAAQVLRQRRGPRRFRPAAAGRLHERDGGGRRPSR